LDAGIWQVILLIGLIIAALVLFRPGRGGGPAVCPRCGFAARPGTPACPRCGRELDRTTIELERLEQARRNGELSENAYRQRKLRLIRGESDSEERHRSSR